MLNRMIADHCDKRRLFSHVLCPALSCPLFRFSFPFPSSCFLLSLTASCSPGVSPALLVSWSIDWLIDEIQPFDFFFK